MFYAHFVLASKGPLARIWLAAHWDKKLTKSHVFETNIESSVEGILQPKVKMALRTSGHLLLGIVRIYSRKAKYLLADCNEAYIKMRMAFRPGVVDLPEAAREAAVATITLPEVFHDFDSVPDIAIDFDNELTLNQSRVEDITIKEDYGNLTLLTEENFDAFDEPEANHEGTNMDEGFENAACLLLGEGEDNCKDIISQSNTSLNVSKPSASQATPIRDDGFGGALGVGILEDAETGSLFEPAGLFDDAPLDNGALDNPEVNADPVLEKPVEALEPPPPQTEENDSDDDMYDLGPGMSPGGPSPCSSPESAHNDMGEPEKQSSQPDTQANSNPIAPDPAVPDILSSVPELPPPPAPAPPPLEQSISNEEETFALAPLDTTIVQGAERTVKAKRKRKLIVDDVKNISGEEMKAQLSDTTDIVVTLDLAPPTKRLMLWKESGGVEKLFALSGLRILSRRLSQLYQLHLSTRTQVDDFGNEEDPLRTLDVEVGELPRERDETGDLGMNNTGSRKRPRRDMNETYHDFSHLEPSYGEATYSTDPNLSHPARAPSMDVAANSFLQDPIFNTQPGMMGLQQQHPPPAHMMPMLPDPLLHLADNLMPHTVAMPGAPLSMSSAMPNVSSPIVPEPFNPQTFGSPDKNIHALPPPPPLHPQHAAHLLSHPETMPDQNTNHLPVAPLMNQFQDQLPQPNDTGSVLDNNLPSHSQILSQLQPPQVDEDATCLNEDYVTNHVDAPPPPPPEDANGLLPDGDKELQQPALENREDVINDHANQAVVVNQEKSPTMSAFDQLAQQPSNNLVDGIDLQNSTVDKEDVEKNDFVLSDDDDYGAPSSVGPALPEEQMADETYEQFEDRILAKRTLHMLHIINGKLEREHMIQFADVVRNNKKKQVAQKFYTFLVLKKQQAVELQQGESYGDLVITRGPKFDAVYNSN